MLGHHIDLSQMGLVLVEIEQGEAHRSIFFVRGNQQATVAAVRAELFHRMDGESHGGRQPHASQPPSSATLDVLHRRKLVEPAGAYGVAIHLDGQPITEPAVNERAPAAVLIVRD